MAPPWLLRFPVGHQNVVWNDSEGSIGITKDGAKNMVWADGKERERERERERGGRCARV